MSIEFEFYCENTDECINLISYTCESESAGEGSQHKAKCDVCDTWHTFSICYEPEVCDIETVN